MFGAELVIVLLAIYLGARLGGIGIGFAGGLGVLVLTLIFQIKPGAIPFDVIEIIMAVIAAIAAMQVAGGMDYLVSLAEPDAAPPPEVHYLPCPAGDLVYDRARWHRPYRLLHAAGDHRSCQRARYSSVSSTVDCGGGLPDSDHRLAHFRRSGLFSQVSLNRWALAI